MTLPTRNNAVGPRVREARSPKRKRRLLAGAAFIGLSLLAGAAVSTQYVATEFNNHEALGFNIGGIYPPWQFFVWQQNFADHYPGIFLRAAGVGLAAWAALFISAALSIAYTARRSKPDDFLHGSARWANDADIKQAGLISTSPDSVYVGAYYDEHGRQIYLRHSGPEHVLCYAPTRSGKGVGLVIPTMLHWTQSAFIIDLKREIWALTAGWRQQYAGNRVIRFEPAAEDGAAWNPLAEVRRQKGEDGVPVFNIGDVQNIATMLVDPDGKGVETHWQKTSFSLLTGAILHALYLDHHRGTPATLPGIRAMLSDPSRPIVALWREMLEFKHLPGGPHPVVAQTARDMLDTESEEASSIISTAKSYLNLYADPVVSANVSSHHFSVRDLMHHNDPVSLYVVTKPVDKERLRPLVRLLVNMTVRILCDDLEFENGRPKATYKHRLLLMLDEMASLKKMPIIQESLAFMAGYGIKAYLIVQDMSQIRSSEMYGQDESISSNCHVQSAFPPNKIETAQHIEKLSGKTTVTNEKITKSGNRFAVMLGKISVTWQETARPLLTADEARTMPGPKKNEAGDIEEPGDMLIFVAGFPAVYGVQPLYFKDPALAARASIPAPRATDRLYDRILDATPVATTITIPRDGVSAMPLLSTSVRSDP
jgi:type IV secretion system protein VirD4